MPETIEALEGPSAPLGRLWIALRNVEVELQPKEGVKGVFADLKWPFNEQEIKEILMTIEYENVLLELGLTNDSRKLIQKIHKTSNEKRSSL